jgi:hypothetical protein
MNVILTYANGEQAMIRVDDDWEAHELVLAMEARDDVVECVVIR